MGQRRGLCFRKALAINPLPGLHPAQRLPAIWPTQHNTLLYQSLPLERQQLALLLGLPTP